MIDLFSSKRKNESKSNTFNSPKRDNKDKSKENEKNKSPLKSTLKDQSYNTNNNTVNTKYYTNLTTINEISNYNDSKLNQSFKNKGRYNLKDYHENILMTNVISYSLGSNRIGDDKWLISKERNENIIKFSKRVKNVNYNDISKNRRSPEKDELKILEEKRSYIMNSPHTKAKLYDSILGYRKKYDKEFITK